jgi:hypothetical protein
MFGLATVPILLDTKRPAIRWGDRVAEPPTADELRDWYARWPNAGVGVIIGDRYAVLDVDEHGVSGLDSLHALEAEHGTLPQTWRAVTPSGGLHIWFALTNGQRASTRELAPGVQLRTGRHVMVMPPAIGREWETSPEDAPLAPLPVWLAAAAREREPIGPDVRIGEGHRHPTMVRLAGAMRRVGADEATILAALHALNRRCDPEKPDAEVEAIARDIAVRYAPEPHADETAAVSSGSLPPIGAPDAGQLFTTRGVDLSKLRPVRFAWRPWLIHGRLNLFVGEEASGKSTLQAWLVAKVTRGTLPGEFFKQPGDVLYVGADEDDWHEVVAPRLYAAGADLSRVREFIPLEDAAVFNAVDHIAELDRELQARPYALVVFEQLMDVLPRLHNPNDPVEMRLALRPLRRVLAVRNVTGLGTLHVNKGLADQLRQRMQGSMQFGALSRSTVLIDKHPTEAGRRIAVLGKANYVAGPVAMSFRIEPCEFALNGQGFDHGVVADVREDDATVEDVLARRRGEREREHDDKLERIAHALTNQAQTVRAIADAAGVAKSTTHDLLKKLADADRASRTDDGWVSDVRRPSRELTAGQDQGTLIEPPDRAGDRDFSSATPEPPARDGPRERYP